MSLFAELKRRNVVRIAVMYGVFAWVVIQLADLLFPLFDIPEWATRLVVILLILGFVAAILFSWVFELTPDGLKREKDIRQDESVTAAHTAKKMDLITISLVVLAIGVFAYSQMGMRGTGDSIGQSASSGPARAAELSIAVLPFVNMSPDADNEFFADGLSEELLNVLAKIEDFKVAGRTSSFAFKGKNEDFKTIGEALNVNTILEGSVRKSGDTVRVTAQLIDVNDGYHLWSETYDRKLDNIFQIQDEIATQVVAALKQELLGEADLAVIAKKSTENLEAHQHYLKGLHHVALRSKDQLELALSEFRQAAKIDPNYALAHTGVAYAYVFLASYSYRSISEVGPLAELALEKAFAIDNQLSEAWAIRATLLSSMGAPDSEVIPMLERAIELNPNNAYAYMWLAGNLFASEPERTAELYVKAYELDPLAPVIVQNMASNNAFGGNMDKAQYFADQLMDIAPDWDGTYRTLQTLAFTNGDMEKEIRWMHKVLELDADSVPTYENLADNYIILGDLDRAQALIDKGRRVNPAYGGIAASEADILLLQGDKEAAVQLMRDMVRRWPDDKFLLMNAARVEAIAGNLEQANSLYLEAFGYTEYPGEWTVDGNFAGSAATFAYVIYQLGETEIAIALSKAEQKFFVDLEQGYGHCWCVNYGAAAAAAAAQDRETTLKWFQIALDRGMISGPVFGLEPIYDFLSDDPEFLAMKQELEQRRKTVIAALTKDGLISDTLLAESGP